MMDNFRKEGGREDIKIAEKGIRKKKRYECDGGRGYYISATLWESAILKGGIACKDVRPNFTDCSPLRTRTNNVPSFPYFPRAGCQISLSPYAMWYKAFVALQSSCHPFQCFNRRKCVPSLSMKRVDIDVSASRRTNQLPVLILLNILFFLVITIVRIILLCTAHNLG